MRTHFHLSSTKLVLSLYYNLQLCEAIPGLKKLLSEPFIPEAKTVTSFLKTFEVKFSDDRQHAKSQKAVYNKYMSYVRSVYRKYEFSSLTIT